MTPGSAWLRGPVWIGAGIFLVGAAVRCARPDAVWFIMDQVRNIHAGRDIVAGHLLLQGPDVGFSKFNLGPLLYYVVAAGLWLRDQPVDCFRLLGVLDAAGVAVYFVLFRFMAGPRLACAAALMLALHPLAVFTARGIWNPSLIAPTTGLFFVGLWIWAEERRAGGLALSLVATVFMLQAHVTTVLLLPFLALGVLRRSPVRSWRVLAAAAFAAAFFVPWLASQAHQLLATGFSVPRQEALDPHTIGYLAGVLTCLTPETMLPEHFPLGGKVWRVTVEAAAAGFGLLVLLGMAAVVTNGERRALRSTLLAGGVLLPAFVLALMPNVVMVWYLAVTWPLRALLATLGAALASRAVGRGAAIGFATVAVLVPFLHMSAAQLRDARTGLTTIGSLNLKFRAPPGSRPQTAPTMFSHEKVGRRLAIGLGMGLEEAALRLRGPWCPYFTMSDFWYEEPKRHGLTPWPEVPEEVSVLISHRDDEYPIPGAAQRVGLLSAGGFRVILFRAGIDRTAWRIRSLATGTDAPWRPWTGRVPRGGAPGVPDGHVALRTRWIHRGAATGAVFLNLVLRFGARVEAVLLDGREIERTGRSFVGMSVVTWFAVPGAARGEHSIELRVADLPPGLAHRAVDVFDVVTDPAR